MKCEICGEPVTEVSGAIQRPLCLTHLHMSAEDAAREKAARHGRPNKAKNPTANKGAVGGKPAHGN